MCRLRDRTRQGYVEHLNAFPDFCERTIRAFHAAGQRSDSSVAAMPMDFSGIKEQAEETESRLREALRTLAEVGHPDALPASAENRARQQEALAQVRAAKEQLERLSALLDSLASIDTSRRASRRAKPCADRLEPLRGPGTRRGPRLRLA